MNFTLVDWFLLFIIAYALARTTAAQTLSRRERIREHNMRWFGSTMEPPL